MPTSPVVVLHAAFTTCQHVRMLLVLAYLAPEHQLTSWCDVPAQVRPSARPSSPATTSKPASQSHSQKGHIYIYRVYRVPSHIKTLPHQPSRTSLHPPQDFTPATKAGRYINFSDDEPIRLIGRGCSSAAGLVLLD